MLTQDPVIMHQKRQISLVLLYISLRSARSTSNTAKFVITLGVRVLKIYNFETALRTPWIPF